MMPIKKNGTRQIKRKKLAIIAISLMGLSLQNIVLAQTKDNIDSFNLAEITVEAKRPVWEDKLSPGSVTIIKPEDYKGEQKTLPELLKKVPGVHVRELNGKGQYTTMTIRGSTAAQVGIFIDGVLTNLGGDAAVDLSTIPIKNVQRIEVYRGYIPSRFGGTFMGGVVNIVTIKPQEAKVSSELGKSSFGGTSCSVQVEAPLGNGSLMFGINKEMSDGDFEYENYSSPIQLERVKQIIASYQEKIDNFDYDNINGDKYVDLSDEEKANFNNNPDLWETFRTDKTEGADNLYNRVSDLSYEKAKGYAKKPSGALSLWATLSSLDKYKNTYSSYSDFLNKYWKNAYTNPAEVEKVCRDYSEADAEKTLSMVNPDTAESLIIPREILAENKEKAKLLSSSKRHRRYNDYNNIDSMIKWQNDEWMVKGAWKRIGRHLPDSLWAGGGVTDAIDLGSYTDTKDTFYASSRRQEEDAREIQIGKRYSGKDIEWGWMVDYLKQNKTYKTEKMYDLSSPRWNTPMRAWSTYDSYKYNVKLDGTYQMNDKNLIEFMSNYSKERLNIDGSKMDVDLTGIAADNLARYRNYYEQELFNAQVQDTITLDDKGSLLLTPSVRYNQSKILGRSNRMRDEYDGSHHWVNKEDDQTDGKTTWQIALKKEINDKLTMRMTGGTYYRLLNLYEIAGDGAGILPPPSNSAGTGTAFPIPEDGKQFDVSAIWRGALLGADSDATITYFWRKSDNMLQLSRRGYDYWSYFNDNRGKAHGVEFQNNYKWDKFDANITVTYTKVDLQRRNTTFSDYNIVGDWQNVWPTYSPEWEGNLRIVYHPSTKFALIGEARYVDEMFTQYTRDDRGGEYDYLAGVPQDSLFTINLGLKMNPTEKWQVNLGCNDVFNRGPKMKIRFQDSYVNMEFPMNGRSYYATGKYLF